MDELRHFEGVCRECCFDRRPALTRDCCSPRKRRSRSTGFALSRFPAGAGRCLPGGSTGASVAIRTVVLARSDTLRARRNRGPSRSPARLHKGTEQARSDLVEADRSVHPYWCYLERFTVPSTVRLLPSVRSKAVTATLAFPALKPFRL